VNRFQIIAVLGLTALPALPACSAADDVPGDRPQADAGRDTRTTVRADGPSTDRLDAIGGGYADEASTTPDPDVTVPDAPSPPPDAPDPPTDAPPPPPDGSSPPPIDATLPPPMDVTPDQAVLSCLVSFTVNGVVWSAPEGGTLDAQSGRAVRLVGDAANLGSWAPSGGVLLTEISSGNWSGTATFRDQQSIEFKFVKFEGTTPEWENWLPYDSNRSLRVECFGDAGVLRDASHADATTVSDGAADRATDGDASSVSDVAGDATDNDGAHDTTADATAHDGALLDATADAIDAVDAGAPSDARVIPVPARGRTYVGVFGVRPPDATK